jgi:diaminopimelate epimerase
LAAARRTRRWHADEALVQLPGGTVRVRQDDAGHLWLAGPARTVARGHLDPEWLAQQIP